jgi:hypothetical protein
MKGGEGNGIAVENQTLQLEQTQLVFVNKIIESLL